MVRKGFRISSLGMAPLALLVACSGGGGGGSGISTERATALTAAIDDVPVVGQLLADCSEAGMAFIDEFTSSLPLPETPAEVPSAEDVLAMADAGQIPVIGGLVPGGLLPGDLVPISVDDALSMIPVDGLPAGLPVIAAAPVSCSDIALPEGDLPVPTDALGLIPVFDAQGDPVALVLAVVGEAQNGAPSIDGLGLPFGTDTLPDPLGSVIGTVLGLLGL